MSTLLPPIEGENVGAGSKGVAVGVGRMIESVAAKTVEVTVTAMVEAIVDPLM